MAAAGNGPTNRAARNESEPTWLRGILDRVGDWANQNPKSAEYLLWALETASTPADGENGQPAVERLFNRVFAPNWWPLRMGAQTAIRQMMLETGLCLAWVPRPEVLNALLGTTSKADRDAVLIAHEAAIIEDIERVLDEVHHERLAAVAAAGQEALDCFRAGHRRGAQTLCATAISDLLDKHFGLESFSVARDRLATEDPNEIDVRAYRRSSVQLTLRAAILTSWAEDAQEGFNRHVTAHTLDAKQFTHAHCLAALLLLTGVLRELHELYTVGDNGVPFIASASVVDLSAS